MPQRRSVSPYQIDTTATVTMEDKYGGTEIKLDGKEYRIFNGDEVLAVIE